jgi:hypothetical protein
MPRFAPSAQTRETRHRRRQIASLACGLAQWPVMLIVARIVQAGPAAPPAPAQLGKS